MGISITKPREDLSGLIPKKSNLESIYREYDPHGLILADDYLREYDYYLNKLSRNPFQEWYLDYLNQNMTY